MWDDQKPSFRLEIGNFSDKEAVIASNVFVAGECEWYLSVHPKGDYGRSKDHLSLFLNVANRKSLQTGWRRRAKYYFLVLNESSKELYRSPIEKASSLFCAWNPAWGIRKTLPLSKFQEKGFLEKDKLIIEVYIKVVDSFDGEGVDMDINGFQVFAAYVDSVKKIFAEHLLKTEYKNTLSKGYTKLSEVAEWLKSKFDEVSFERKNADGVDEYLVQQLEERLKNLELMVLDFKKDCLKSKLEDISFNRKSLELMELGFKLNSFKSTLENNSLEKKKSHDADESRFEKLEESVKNLDLMELGFKMDSFKSKLEEISLEKKKSHDANESRVQKLKESVLELGFELDSFKSKLEEISLEKKKPHEADESRVQNLEESVKNLELLELGFKLDSFKSKLEEVSLEKKKSYEADESRVQKLEENVLDLGFKMESFESKLEEISLEKKTSHDADESRIQKLEESVLDLGFKLESFKSKLEEISLEKKKSYDANESRAQLLERRIKNIELMDLGFKLACVNTKLDNAVESRVQQLEERVMMEVGFKLDCLSTKIEKASLERNKFDDARFQQLEESVKNIFEMLKVELDKKKDKSSDDGFLLVN